MVGKVKFEARSLRGSSGDGRHRIHFGFGGKSRPPDGHLAQRECILSVAALGSRAER